jgi:hypothetical protein
MKRILMISFITLNISTSFAEEFIRQVESGLITAECDAKKGDERGPFGITYREGNTKHDFLVMTGVYYETCKDLESRINLLKRRNSHLVLRGSGKGLFAPNNYVWRWHSIRSISKKVCVSYFSNDCEN